MQQRLNHPFNQPMTKRRSTDFETFAAWNEELSWDHAKPSNVFQCWFIELRTAKNDMTAQERATHYVVRMCASHLVENYSNIERENRRKTLKFYATSLNVNSSHRSIDTQANVFESMSSESNWMWKIAKFPLNLDLILNKLTSFRLNIWRFPFRLHTSFRRIFFFFSQNFSLSCVIPLKQLNFHHFHFLSKQNEHFNKWIRQRLESQFLIKILSVIQQINGGDEKKILSNKWNSRCLCCWLLDDCLFHVLWMHLP